VTEPVFETLRRKLGRMHDAFHGLELTAVHDGPPSETNKLVDDYAESVENATECVRRALAAASEVLRRISSEEPDWVRGRRALVACHTAAAEARMAFLEDLAENQKLEQLREFGLRDNGRWQKWVRCVMAAIPGCWRAMDEVAWCMAACWRDFAGARLAEAGFSNGEPESRPAEHEAR
jgi:hypothetical protein